MSFIFFSNLGDENAKELAESAGSREAVLLSAPGASRRMLEAAEQIRGRNIPLAADNANTAAIFKIAREFVDEAARLKAAAAAKSSAVRSRSAASPPASILPEHGLAAAEMMSSAIASLQAEAPRKKGASSIAERRKALMLAIAERCGEFATDDLQRAALAAQSATDPVFLTCLEDLTVPILVQLDLEPSSPGRWRKFFTRLQKRGLRLAEQTIKGELGRVNGIPHAVVHALDYDGAFQTGALAGQNEKLQGIATGLASFLNDRNFASSYILRGCRYFTKGKKSVPQRYLRALAVTGGLINGFHSVRGRLPRFHGLGAGSPIIIPLLSLLGRGSPLFSVDSTAPEKNASMGKIFVDQPAPMTVSVEKVANALLAGRRLWDCPCPHCAEIAQARPFDLAAARNYHEAVMGGRDVEKRDLEKADGIGRHLSLLWETYEQPHRRQIMRARTNHSLWVMSRITAAIREHSRSAKKLRQWVGGICSAYQETTTDNLALQIDECLRLADRIVGLRGR